MLAFITWFWVEYGDHVQATAGLSRGEHGDMYGGLNALFSGWAFTAVVLALFLQQRELSLQQRELETLTSQARDTAAAVAEQIRLLRAQALAEATPILVGGQLEYIPHGRRGNVEGDYSRFDVKISDMGPTPPIFDVRVDPSTGEFALHAEPLPVLEKGRSFLVEIRPPMRRAEGELKFRVLFRDRIGNEQAAHFQILQPHGNSEPYTRMMSYETLLFAGQSRLSATAL